jgi:hypothetical protein|tara:strand:- start:854 stop:1036 length:183 start_codon:yes stop_codon:yes gene_type:complete
MKLPKEYKKYAVPGGYEKCSSAYGRKMLKRFGFGPTVKTIESVVEPTTKKKATRKKKSTK